MRRLYEWKLMNPPASNSTASTTAVSNNPSTGNYPSQEERYKKLLAQIDKEKQFDTSIITLNDNALVFNLVDPNDKNKITPIAIVYKPYTSPPHWVMAVGKGYGVEYKDWNELLEIFEIPGVIKDISSLKESVSSIAEEFKAFSNMWMTGPQQKESPNDLYIIYYDFDDGSYDILYADSNLELVKKIFKYEATDFMAQCRNADQTVNLLHIKLNELSVVDDKEFISLVTYYNADSWDEKEFTSDENKLFSKYEKLFWPDPRFSVLYSFTDVEAYDVAVDQELDPDDMTESEWRKFVEDYIEDSIT